MSTDTIQPLTYENDFAEFITKRDQRLCVLIDEEMFDYWLEVLPPRFMYQTIQLMDGRTKKVCFGFAEGAERITAFWKENGHYFAQHTTLVSRGD